MKFYKGDYVKDKIGREGTIIGRDDLDRLSTTLATGIYFDPELTLIRRADETEWPTDVPRCELTLPEGKTRWAYRGKAWRKDKASFALLCEEEWVKQLTDRAEGFSHHYYAEAVNDEDYIPPQLSETTNSSQVESKITKGDEAFTLRHKDLPNCWVLFRDGNASIAYRSNVPAPGIKDFPALAELLTAAAKEAQQ